MIRHDDYDARLVANISYMIGELAERMGPREAEAVAGLLLDFADHCDQEAAKQPRGNYWLDRGAE